MRLPRQRQRLLAHRHSVRKLIRALELAHQSPGLAAPMQQILRLLAKSGGSFLNATEQDRCEMERLADFVLNERGDPDIEDREADGR